MKQTPLYTQHTKLGARMGEFGGWDMPIQYAGILQEHEQTRENASVFDICHMGEVVLSGPAALLDLEKLLTCNVKTLEIGQVRYGFMLNDDGGTLDDLTCYRMGVDRYMLVVNAGTAAKDAEWIKSNISADTQFVDLSASMAKLDVQGPKSREVLQQVLGIKRPDLGYFRFYEYNDWLISRTGYTGEWGYEIYLPVSASEGFWDNLLEHDLCEPGGLGARDTLRLEMGYPLYGHELSESRTPITTSRGAFIDMGKEFIGKEHVLADLADPGELLVGLRFDSKRAAREHDKVFDKGVEVGEVTSGSVAPSLGVAVAMALVEPEFAEEGRELQVEIRSRKFPATVVELPFYKEGTARG